MFILYLNRVRIELFDNLLTKCNVIWFDNLCMMMLLLRIFRWQGYLIEIFGLIICVVLCTTNRFIRL